MMQFTRSTPARRAAIGVLFSASLAADTAAAGDYEKGAGIWREHCQLCHGADGAGAQPGVPPLWQGRALYLGDDAIEEIIRFGDNAMPGFAARLRRRDIDDVITYMRLTF